LRARSRPSLMKKFAKNELTWVNISILKNYTYVLPGDFNIFA
jgi:hypothetical protein